ncbi:beta-ketoacyl-ACP reductase [Phaeodactylibacter luteus]|uniref:Beta-ketoacyl-ACP reductase n=1 Tax=Phaeodactylibacter luteus TaxID=1564516 RepID=A0A5C6RGH5_9BACT|nr:beta-ketoacyl-ACP reductase [Phaeodactylibacter luteus]TXB61407.1 beta-ketoacyl-ACP reductase [Phaeodactylibacter luteus]
MKGLEGKVAIITGGAMGIGKATAIRFASEGAKIAIWDINEDQGKALAQELGGHFFAVNTSSLEACEAAAKAVNEAFGQIDIIINNAGITRDATMKKMTADQWQQVIDVNLTGVFNCTKAVLPYMLERNFGRILSAASVVAHNGNFGQTNYVATKAGVIGMTKVWAKEFGRKGITANAVAPGFIGTEMVLTIPEKVIDMLKEKTPVPRLGEPAEIAAAYAFLASDDAAFINGAVLNVDGGVTL